jgi:acetyl-CoA acetyltransferase
MPVLLWHRPALTAGHACGSIAAGEGGLSRTSQYHRYLMAQMEQLRMIKVGLEQQQQQQGPLQSNKHACKNAAAKWQGLLAPLGQLQHYSAAQACW